MLVASARQRGHKPLFLKPYLDNIAHLKRLWGCPLLLLVFMRGFTLVLLCPPPPSSCFPVAGRSLNIILRSSPCSGLPAGPASSRPVSSSARLDAARARGGPLLGTMHLARELLGTMQRGCSSISAGAIWVSTSMFRLRVLGRASSLSSSSCTRASLLWVALDSILLAFSEGCA
jgi:hypothetical protein